GFLINIIAIHANAVVDKINVIIAANHSLPPLKSRNNILISVVPVRPGRAENRIWPARGMYCSITPTNERPSRHPKTSVRAIGTSTAVEISFHSLLQPKYKKKGSVRVYLHNDRPSSAPARKFLFFFRASNAPSNNAITIKLICPLRNVTRNGADAIKKA